MFTARDSRGGAYPGIFRGTDQTIDSVIYPGDTLFGSTLNCLQSRGVINNMDQIAFTYELANGTLGVAVATERVIVDVTIDILADTITPKTKWINCRIWPPDGYSYADIDVESILLEWEIPVSRYSFNEKKQRLIVKFPASGLNLEPNPDPLELAVSGELIDGAVFEGSDFVQVVKKGGKKN